MNRTSGDVIWGIQVGGADKRIARRKIAKYDAMWMGD